MKKSMLTVLGVCFLVNGFAELKAQNDTIVKDADGNVYKTVTMGTQVWMTDNLKTTKYSDGTAIPLDFEGCNNKLPSYIFYDDDKKLYFNTCGALYNWYTVATGKLCPTGWHVPGTTEWSTLITYLAAQKSSGVKLKDIGFTTPLAGFRYCDDEDYNAFDGLGVYDFWWSATGYDTYRATFFSMRDGDGVFDKNNALKKEGYSVRCIKN